jgi:putative tricarboxylic transport membrane protein
VTEPSEDTRERPGGVSRTDLITGALSVAVGAAVIPYAVTMPRISEGLPGPGLFPGIIGAFLIVFGLAVLGTAFWRARSGRVDAAAPTGVEAPGSPLPDPVDGPAPGERLRTEQVGAVAPGMADTTRGRWLNGAVILGSIVFYIVAAETLGFPVTIFLVLTTIMLTLGTRLLLGLAVALGVTGLLYLVFEELLLVQLPDGFLGF